MKQTILLLSLFAWISSCTENKPPGKGAASIHKTTDHEDPYSHIEGTPDDNYYNPEYLHFHDISAYDKRFIEEIEDLRKHSGYTDFIFTRNKFIINGKDTFYFPKFPEMDREIILTGKKDSVELALKVTRVNYTSVDFEVEMIETGKARHYSKGRATLPGGFFLRRESESFQGKDYPVAEFSYQDEKNNDCFAVIRIGKNGSGRFFAGLTKNCNGKIKDISTGEFPFLVEK